MSPALSFYHSYSQQQLKAHCKAYILGLIRGILMLDKIDNKFYLMYLTLMRDINHACTYS